ncbi:DISARM system helicase DrmA [Paenibacillus sp. 843]|uniref:DISARM system helicase DrmA n=1 Tax=Paenibacillus sp. 843 TaxID=3341795 RepID=UPI00372AD060
MADNDKVSIRSELIRRIDLELIGPNENNEELNESPAQRYLSGILWPIGTEIDKEDDERNETEEDGEEAGLPDNAAPLMQAMKPSSIGLSFVVEQEFEKINVNCSWGTYIPTGGKGNRGWKRISHDFPEEINLVPADGKRYSKSYDKDPDIQLEWISRPLKDGLKRYAVSLFLVNRKQKPEKGPKDAVCIFQPIIIVTGPKNSKPFSVRRMNLEQTYKLPDVAADELVYRKQTVFAVGHGVSVNWDGISDDRQHVSVLTTKVMPVYEIPRVIPPDWDGQGTLDMKKIASATSGEEIYGYLEPLLDKYDQWVFERELEVDDLNSELKSTGEEHLRLCRESLNRMRKGLDLIRSNGRNGEVFKAFQLANRVMFMQRTQSVWARNASKKKDWSNGPEEIKTTWRPFQIAFILQSLTGIVEPQHGDRKIADLLWFPTGGGKTEAYLGLAAFVMAIRRLRKEENGLRGDAGVSILMRYTLRLLTIQQFQRASTLICACEIVRNEDPNTWGKEPFRIGLWVGGKNTPNSYDECEEVLRPGNSNPTTTTPVQLVACPWCGSKLTKKDYNAIRKMRRVIIGCSRKECEFSRTKRPFEGIPAVVSDEEIYRLLPTMIIGTVDKFARLPWVGETQALVGKVKGQINHWGFVAEGSDKNTETWIKQVVDSNKGSMKFQDERTLLPPDLIIQDELHLISGPLGTMVGLYETAIDYLCSRDVDGQIIGPKVVASTATIRRAKEQVLSLFARRLAIFPSPGLLAEDSFFALEQPIQDTPGRTYVGIFAPGRSVKTAIVRVYAALLSATEAMEYDIDDLDPYRTIVGYYNSLRELGGAVRLIEDDIKARMKVLAQRDKGQLHLYKERVIRESVPELTSRVDSSEIPPLLQRLEQPFSASSKEVAPVDVVLASNMISVGVDVGRLGLMAVTGQPKTTAEYIQATSRVGREHPGLVFTIYNWARPRDVSHYERFNSYHSALYRYVEAISVTPFSSRARDRALSATLVAMTRLMTPGLAKREHAKKFKPQSESVKKLADFIKNRVKDIEQAKVQEVLNDLQVYIDRWEQHSVSPELYYDKSQKKPRLMYPLGGKPKGAAFGVPNSMRDVEKTVGIYLLRE